MKTYQILHRIVLALTVMLTTGCYNELDSNSTPITLPYISESDFFRVDSIENTTTGLKIRWTLGSEGKNITGYRIYRYNVNSPVLIATVNPSVNFYIDGTVVTGTKYSYLVRAVDPSGDEDRNTVRKYGIFWEGLTSVTSVTQSKIQVTFSTQLKGYRLYLYLKGEGRPRTQVAVISSDEDFSVGTYDIFKWPDNVSLKAGASYEVSAEIMDVNSSLLDGNRAAYPVTTLSFGYHSISGQKQGWNNIATVRAFGESFGSEPLDNTTTFSDGGSKKFSDYYPSLPVTDPTLLNQVVPNLAQVEIGFVPFSLPAGLDPESYRYQIIRAQEGTVFNTSTLASQTITGGACPSTFNDVTSLQPCIVVSGIHPVSGLENGLIVAHDTTVWDSDPVNVTPDRSKKPPRYRYFVTLQHLNDPTDISKGTFTEEVPQDQFEKFSVLVPIPPPDMVLVNRESVNYEFCKVQQSKTTDPLKHNRCEHFETGMNTFNSGPGNSFLNLQNNYYDFGYNLFVDRYPLACNNDLADIRTAVGNVSLTNATSTSVLAAQDPTGNVVSTFNNGDSLFTLVSSAGGGDSLRNGGMTNCRVYNNGNWVQVNNITTTFATTASQSAAFRSLLTSSPEASGVTKSGNPKFNYPRWTKDSAQAACNSFSGSGYGLKRIPRMREFRAFTAPPFEINIDGKNLKDFYAQAINAATATTKADAGWKPGSCLRVTTNSASINSTIENIISGAGTTPDTVAEMFTGNTFKMAGLASGATQANLMSFMLGSKMDALCMSKYGINGVYETSATYNGAGTIPNALLNGIISARYPVTDLFSWDPSDTAGGSLTGIQNNQDPGNYDLSLNILGISTGYYIPFALQAGTLASPLRLSSFSQQVRFDQALGIPAITDETGNLINYTSSISPAKNYESSTNSVLFVKPADAGETSVNPQVASRYTTSFDSNVTTRVRCVIPAE
jgi:hypothetical protein